MLATLENVGKRHKLLATREDARKRRRNTPGYKSRRSSPASFEICCLANHNGLFVLAPLPALSYTTMSAIRANRGIGQRNDLSLEFSN